MADRPRQLELLRPPGEPEPTAKPAVSEPARSGVRRVEAPAPAPRELRREAEPTPVAATPVEAPTVATPTARPGLRLIQGEGQRERRPLRDRNDLARVLAGAAADMLLRRTGPSRMEALSREVDRLLALFDRVDRDPKLKPQLEKGLAKLEASLEADRDRRRR